MTKHHAPYQQNEEIPRPWKKYRSNKGNWYYYNPETNISVWDLKEYLKKQDQSYHSEDDYDEESEFSVSKHDGSEIVLDSAYASVYDEIFNAPGDDDEYDDCPRSKSIDPSSNAQKSSLASTRSSEKPLNATSAKCFASKKTVVTNSSVAPPKETESVYSKKIVNLRPEPSVVAPITEDLHGNTAQLVQAKKDPLDNLDIASLLEIRFVAISNDTIPTVGNEFGSFSLKTIQSIRSVKRSKSNFLLDFLSIANPILQQTPMIIAPNTLIESHRYLHDLLY